MFHLDKKDWIFILIFAIISIVVTVFLIANNSSKKTDNLKNKDKTIKIEADNLGIKSKEEKYDMNSIYIEKIYDKWDKQVGKDDEYNVNLLYFKIDGLSDKEIQNKINDKISQKVYEIYNEAKSKGINKVSVNYSIMANFSNVISIDIYGIIDKEDRESSLNIDLATGEEIPFEALFTNTTSIKNILSQSIYTSLLESYTTPEDEDGDGIDYSNTQEKIFEMMYRYLNNQAKLSYTFTPQNIYLIMDDLHINIPMIKYYENIAIYNRYKTAKSIFTGKYNNPKNLLVFENRTDSIYAETELTDGGYYDFHIQSNLSKEDKEKETKIIDFLNNRYSDEYRKYKQEHKDKITMFSISFLISKNENNGKIEVYTDYYIKGNSSKDLYLSKIKEELFNYIQTSESSNQEDFSGLDNEIKIEQADYEIFSFNFEEGTYSINKNINSKEEIKTYDINTNEEIIEEPKIDNTINNINVISNDINESFATNDITNATSQNNLTNTNTTNTVNTNTNNTKKEIIPETVITVD